MGATEQAAVESDASQRLIDNATEGMLGPNPFIGFRPQDIAAAFGELARQAVQHPAIVLAQEAALLRELMATSDSRTRPGRRIRSTESACRPISPGRIQWRNSWINRRSTCAPSSAFDSQRRW